MNAGKLASQARAAQEQIQRHVTTGNIYPAPPPAYTTLNPNSYGWVPMDRFPDRPAGDNVFMYDQPPPYSGIFDQKDQKTNSFDERHRVQNVTNGFVSQNDPSKVYVPSAPQNVRDLIRIKRSVLQSPDRIGPAIFEVPKSPGDILTLND
jgi:hypothetical protein